MQGALTIEVTQIVIPSQLLQCSSIRILDRILCSLKENLDESVNRLIPREGVIKFESLSLVAQHLWHNVISCYLRLTSQRIRVHHPTRDTSRPRDLLRLSPYKQNTCKTCYEQQSLSFITAIYIDGSGEAGYNPLFPSLLRRLVDENVRIQTVILSHLTWSRISNDAQAIIMELRPVQNLYLSNFGCAVEDFLGFFLAFRSLNELEFERYLLFHGTTTVSVSISNVVSKLLTLPGQPFRSSFGPIFVDNHINHTPMVFGYHLTELTITVEVKQYSDGYDFIRSLKWWGCALQSTCRPNTLNTITFNLTIDKIMLKHVISTGANYAGGWVELDDALGNPESVFQLKRLGFEVRGDIDPNWAQWLAQYSIPRSREVYMDSFFCMHYL
ncbi:hypothetical protein EDD18DRAFT_1100570 [Armillaria luteobubalina]|uniref:Uncharacterized protein n=1 Tax=Armillaria luteobubalina TaxID=153913 RepID=A0AA39QFR3_9AGAR|nr:hypothetical protein EDD18DRAFT_1100570 [Armillaria luteobubalina]